MNFELLVFVPEGSARTARVAQQIVK